MVLYLKKWWWVLLFIIALSVYFWRYKTAPNIQLNHLVTYQLNGDRFTLANNNNYLFISFIASWCGPCRKEIPEIVHLSEKMSSEKLKFYFISDETTDKLKRLKKQYPFDFELLKMENNRKDLGIYTIPTTYIISPSGELLYKKTDYKDWSTEESYQLIKKLIDQ